MQKQQKSPIVQNSLPPLSLSPGHPVKWMRSCEVKCSHLPLKDRGPSFYIFEPPPLRNKCRSMWGTMYQNKQEKKRKKRNQHLKSITNPVNKSPTHRAHSRHNARAPSVCFHGKRLHPQGRLVGPLKGTDIPSSLETMVRGKSKPNLERGKSCQSMSCLCLSQPGALRTEVLSDNRADGAWGCAPHMSAKTSTWALNSWPAPQALTQQPPTPCRVQGAPSQEPRQRGCLLPVSGLLPQRRMLDRKAKDHHDEVMTPSSQEGYTWGKEQWHGDRTDTCPLQMPQSE